MTANPVSADDIKRQFADVLRAISVLESFYPEHKIQLVPKVDARMPNEQSADDHRSGDAEPSPDDTIEQLAEAGSIRDKVIRATHIGWMSLDDLIAATGLTKRQIYGVLTAPDTKATFDRRRVNGAKQYRLRTGEAVASGE